MATREEQTEIATHKAEVGKQDKEFQRKIMQSITEDVRFTLRKEAGILSDQVQRAIANEVSRTLFNRLESMFNIGDEI